MLNSLQACRAIAAILVVLFHLNGSIFNLPKYFDSKPLGPIFDFGYAGVDFFFVLSGFIMIHVHAEDIGQPRALGSYLWKRFSRIYPPYWIVLAVLLPIYFIVPHFGAGHERDLDVIIRSVLLVPHPEAHQVLVVAWTLVYEVFFYLLFGSLILNKRLGITIFLAWTVGVLASSYFEHFPWTFLFNQMHIRFLAGMGVAMIWQRWPIPFPRLVAIVGAAVFLGAGLLDTFNGPLSPSIQTLGFTLGSSLALAGLVQAESSRLIQTPRLLVYLGNASYSIYLIHFPALSVLAKATKAARLDLYIPGPILFFLLAVGSIGVGCVFHHVAEQPLQRWSRRFFRREKPSASVFAPPDLSVSKAA